MFTSDPVLTPFGAGGLPTLLGRIGFTTATVTDESGQFRPELLALWLFRRPHRVLAAIT
jgi:hypothetical protein